MSLHPQQRELEPYYGADVGLPTEPFVPGHGQIPCIERNGRKFAKYFERAPKCSSTWLCFQRRNTNVTWMDLTGSKLCMYTLLGLLLISLWPVHRAAQNCYTQEMNGAKITLVTFPVTAHFYGVKLSCKSCSHTDLLLLVKVLFTAASPTTNQHYY